MKYSTPARTALKKLLSKEFCIIESNENNIKGKHKAEGLHKLRIAVRKTRTLLRQANYVFPERTILKYDHDFKYLAQKTCKARDLDVFLKTLDRFRVSMHEIPKELHNDIYKFAYEDKIKKERELSEYLYSVKYARLKNDWKKILNKPDTKNNSKTNTNQTIDYVLKNGIGMLYRKMLEQGNAINVNTPYSNYHDLRKTCKKLRYLLEYLHDLHSRKKTRTLIKTIKNVQDILGDLQDKQIQIKMLDNFIKTRRQNNLLSDKSACLVDLLVKKLDRQCQKIKAGYPDIYSRLLNKLDKNIDDCTLAN